jgi:Flp pilus assembly protein TadG
MNSEKESILRRALLNRALKEQHGQVLPWVAFMMVLFLGMAAFVLDIGHAYFCYRELQGAVDAAALAGAQNLKAASPSDVVAQYDAESGGLNSNGNLSINGANSVSMAPGYPKYACLGSPTTQAACQGPEDANAIQVKEQAVVPTFFARVFGISQMTVSAIATSAIVGAKNQPTNIAIILDTTASMKTVDSNCSAGGGSAERVVCAEQGVSTLLQNLSPCNTALGCGTMSSSGIAQYALDSVAIFTFPNVTTDTASDDYNCSGTNPSIPAYSLPTIGSSTYAPGTASGTPTYQVTPFMSNYKSGDSGSSLDTASNLAMAVGSGVSSSGSNCPGMQAPGGDGTYYAGVIYAAQAALTAQAATETAADSSLNPVNIMIILTDGEANSTKIAGTAANGTKTATTSTWPAGGGATSSITNYPSTFDQCQQAVAAANYAKSQGTQVYSIAYGSESSGCTTDSSGPQPNITPCQVMSQMASPNVYNSSGTLTKTYFYSDYNQSGSSSTCVSTGTSVSDMAGIFGAISNDLLTVRLLPESVWPAS